MGFLSQSGFIGFKTQSARGVYADPSAAPPNQGVYARLRSGSLGINRDLLIPDPEIGGNRDVPDAYLGAAHFAGDLEMYARMEAVATLLRGAMGSVSSSATGSGTTTVGTHVITGADALPWISAEEQIANNYEHFQYTDAKVNTFHVEAEANGYMMATAGLIAVQQEGGVTPSDPTDRHTDVTPMMVGTNIAVTYNSVALPAKSFSLDIANNLEDDDYRLGSLLLGDVTEKRREFTMSVSIRPQDSALWRQAAYGSAAATEVGGLSTKQALQLVATTYEFIGTQVVAKYTFQVDAPKVIIRPYAITPSGDDVLQHDFDMQFLRPDPAVQPVTFTVKNGLATVA